MFQVEPILFLQSLDTPFVTGLMRAVSFIGYIEFILPLLLIFSLAVDLKRGFAILHIVLWTAVVTSILKVLFSLPRPYVADLRVLMLEESIPNTTPFENAGAPGFLAAIPPDVIEYHRQEGLSNGFPSGHASIATALWGSFTLMIRGRMLRIAALAIIFLTPLSRMFLGKHFLADAIAGVVLGAVILAFCFQVARVGQLQHLLSKPRLTAGASWEWALLAVYFLVLPFLLFDVPDAEPEWLGALFGLNLAFLLIWIRGFPSDGGRFSQRGMRTLIGILLFVLSDQLLKLAGISETASLDFSRTALASFLLLWGGVTVGMKFGFYSAPQLPSNPPANTN